MREGSRLIPLLLAASCLVATETPAAEPEASSPTFFELKIRPILAGSCLKCHGATKQSGGLRLDSREAILKGGKAGPAAVAGRPDGSPMIAALRHGDDDDLKMPPNGPLPKQVRADLSAWVAAGLPWPAATASAPLKAEAHWAFEPLRPVGPPADTDGWASQPIDRFLVAEMKPRGLKPMGRADRRTLIRRATYDLTGLPPTPERIQAFLNDDRPDAFARLVDELLASPRYGERWGRYWLDLARYADTAGDNSDYPIREAYLYRDYVIDAFNADIPYDRFLHEQIAGDLLAARGPESDYGRQVIATGFLSQAKRFGTRKLEDPHQIIEDTLNTIGQVTMGLSLRCARCHDHKFDPITQRDYYALYGFFEGTKYPFAGAEEDRRPSEFAPIVPPSKMNEYRDRHATRLKDLQARLAEAEKTGEASARVRDAALDVATADFLAAVDPKAVRTAAIATAKAELTRVTRQRDQQLRSIRGEIKRLTDEGPIAIAPVAYAVREGKPTDAKLQKGGDPRRLGPVIPRGVLKVLEPDGTIDLPKENSGRLELARWLTEGGARPLVARVMANRIWQHHFGKPIVATPSDFGLRGIPPTHPRLLEHLAAEFVASGWSIKALHRKIMLTQAYQLASDHDSANASIDTGNTYYWRFDRRPLDAEALRDSLLAIGGNLELARPGPHPFPAVDTWRYTAHHQFKALYDSNHRSVYLMVQRLHPHPYLSLFNGPDTSVTTATRDASTVALQALYLLNSPFVHEQSRKAAVRWVAQEDEPVRRLDRAFLSVFGRKAGEKEREQTLNFLKRYQDMLAQEEMDPAKREIEAWSALARTIFASNEFVSVD